MSLDITPGDGIVGELALLGDLIVGGFPEAVFTLPGVSVDEVLDHARLYLGFAEAAQTAQAKVRALELPEFVGVEGEFFRGRVPGDLAMQLGAAVESYSRVGSGIKELARELDASQTALKPLEARARAVFEHMQKVWIKVNVPFTEYSGLRSEWDELVRAAGVVHERVAAAGQQAAAQINAGTEAMVPVNDYFSTLPGGAVAGGALAKGVRSTAAHAASAAGGVTGAPGPAVKATANGLGAAAGAAISVPQQITARGQQLAPQVTPDGIKVGDHLLTDPTSEQAQKLVREGQATNILGLDPTGIPTAMMMLASPNTLIREQRKPTKAKPGRRWTTEAGDPRTTATAKDESVVGQVVSVPGRFVGGAVDRFGNTIAGNAALIGVGGDPVRAWSGLAKNVTSPVAGVGRFAASATPEQILADPVAAAGSAATHAPVAVPFVGWAYGIVEALSKPGELAREGAKETLTSALDTLTLKNLEAGQQVANTGEVHVTTSDVDVHADNGGYITFTLPDLEGGEPKAWYILATPDSPGNFTTNVPTAPGEELIERADGSVVLVNTATSQTVRTIKTPWAKDALGRDQPTWYSVERLDDSTSTITQHIAPNKGALYPLVADSPQSDLAAAQARLAAGGLKPAGPTLPEPAPAAPVPAAPVVSEPSAVQAPVVTATVTPIQAQGPHLPGTPPPTVTPAPTQPTNSGSSGGSGASGSVRPGLSLAITPPATPGAPVEQTASSGDRDTTGSSGMSETERQRQIERLRAAGVGLPLGILTGTPETPNTGSGSHTGSGSALQQAVVTNLTPPGAPTTPQQDLAAATASLKPRTYGPTEEEMQTAAAAIAKDREHAPEIWNKIAGEDSDTYRKFFPKDVYPLEKSTSAHNGTYTTAYRMSDGSTLRLTEDNAFDVPRFGATIENSPTFGDVDVNSLGGTVSQTRNAGQMGLEAAENVDTALQFVPGIGLPPRILSKGTVEVLRRTVDEVDPNKVNVNAAKTIDEQATTKPASTAVKPETTAPVKPETTVPVKPETTAPVKPETTVPVKPETTVPVKPETTVPVKPETTAPVKPETTVPVKPETTAPVKPETTAPVKPETTVPVKPETTAPVKPETTVPVKPETTAPVKPETTVPVKPEATVLPDRSPAPGNPWPKVDPSFNPPKNAPDTVSRLPSGRRPSNSNWAGHTYDFRNTPETQPELLEKFPDGVYFGKEGFPDFGPYTIKTVRLDGEFTGRRADYALADAKAGFGPSNPRPKGYVWHHHQDRHTMQLVREPVHDGARHAGGIALRQGPKGSDRIR